MLNTSARRAPLIFILFLLSGASVMFNEVSCLTTFGILRVNRSDCYERLAIGQRLDENDVYQETESNTVKDCQMDCTRDKDKCRSFSFGIGIKGNASCQLSSHVVKETVDLKPIGTIDDTEFDLYIKKLGCELAIPVRSRPDHYKKHHGFHYGSEQQSSFNSESHWSSKKNTYKGNRPLDDNDRAVSYNRYEKPGSYDKPHKHTYEDDKPDSYDNSDKLSFTNPFDDLNGPTYYKPSSEEEKHKPISSGYGSHSNDKSNADYNNRPTSSGYESSYGKPTSDYGDRPTSGYGSSHNKPSSDYDNRPAPGYGVSHSSTKPGYDSNPKPPFRPVHLDNPYNNQNDHYPAPWFPDPDNPNYEPARPPKPSYDQDNHGYGNSKPHKPPKLEDSEGYIYKRPSNSNGYNYDKPSEFDFGGYHYPKPTKPSYGDNVKPVIESDRDMYEYPKRPTYVGGFYSSDRPIKPNGPYGSQHLVLSEIYGSKYPYQNPTIKDHVDPYGHLVTTVIGEIGSGE